MAKKTVLRRAGGSVTVTIPKEMAERFNLEAGSEVTVEETEKGILLMPYDPEFERAMQVFERGASKYRDALRELAK